MTRRALPAGWSSGYWRSTKSPTSALSIRNKTLSARIGHAVDQTGKTARLDEAPELDIHPMKGANLTKHDGARHRRAFSA